MSIVSDLIERIRALVLRDREERDFAEEARVHLEMEVEHRVRAGENPADARRQARLAFGGAVQVTEEVRDARGTRWLLDTAGDFRFAVRALRQRPGFSIVAILTIAIGIGGTTAVFSAVDAVLLRPLPYRDPGALVRLYSTELRDPARRSVVTPVHFLAYRDRLTSVQPLAAINRYDKSGADIGRGASLHRIRTLQVSAEYFDVLGVHPVLGRTFRPSEQDGPDDDTTLGPPLAILSDRLWRQQLDGDPSAVGRTLLMSGRRYTVVGVMARGFVDPLDGPEVDAWIPVNLTPGKNAANNSQNHYLSVIGRLKPGVSLARAQAELSTLGATLAEEFPNANETRARLDPLKEDIVGGARNSLVLILGAVGLVLLLVCVNIANLLMVRGSERAREFAMRAALGARARRLARQLLTESAVLALAGALLGLLVGRVMMSAIVALGGASIPRLAGLSLDLRLLAFSIGVAALSALLFGLAPAWRAGRADPAEVLRRQGRSATGDRVQGRLRGVLVISQIALAFVLLVGAGLLLLSFRRLHDVPLGVQPEGVLTFQLHLPEARYDSGGRAAFYHRFDRAVTALPGVLAAGATSRLPATGSYHAWAVRALTGPLTGTKQANTGAQERIITPGFFRALGIRPLSGRTFDDRDNSAAPDRVVITKQMAAALYPGVEAVGQRLRTGGHNSDVIGVVTDIAVDPDGRTDGFIFHAHDQFSGDRNWPLFELVRASGSLPVLATSIRRALADLDPELVMDQAASLTDVIGNGTAQRTFTLQILLAFAATALLLAALGVFGVLAYVVKLRGQEFGIRMALGATTRAIKLAVFRQALVVTVMGLGAGIAGAFAMSRMMATMVFRVSPLEPGVMIAAAATIVMVSGVAAWLPARRAATVAPRSVLQ